MSGIYHNLFLLSLGPWMTIFLLHLIFTSCVFNTALYPELQSFKVETRELCVRLGMMWPSNALSVKAWKSSKHGFFNCIV